MPIARLPPQGGRAFRLHAHRSLNSRGSPSGRGTAWRRRPCRRLHGASQHPPEPADRGGVQPEVGSSSSHSGARLSASRDSASRRFCPADSMRDGSSASSASPTAASASVHRTAGQPRRRSAGSPPPSGPASPRPGGRHRRRAAAWVGRSASASSPSHSSRPAAGRTSPASSRSRVDLPDPFGPVSSSAPPARHLEIQVAEDQPLAADHRQTFRLQHASRPRCSAARWTIPGRCGLSRAAGLPRLAAAAPDLGHFGAHNERGPATQGDAA